MAKQLNVSVAVTADTSQAKAQLQQLQTSLQQLSTSSTNLHLGLNTSELNKAIADVDKLQAHLKNATNANGLLDFGKLNTSIKQSGSTLTEYGNQLLKLGPQGQQAFNQLTQAITKSEVPVNRMKTVLGEFGTVLGNTIKWQAASSAIHGMMGSIQHAFSYAQQLNQSLNRIQIVTQASNEHMAQFAEQANKAAKSLSTTTTAYTNASLIYYQQGLNDKQVAERTNATIKLANVSGQSAEKVSNQMTAIWNNFDDGTKSLEYYADVITALGAATASSSEEIATGLQKFAAVADTVGLSYENATAALATITAQTRQSADTVGTGLRTLFARLQSLSLGETLDDGVSLTKYSKALDTIGVKVIDMSGNLRNADDIIADMGEKWQDLSNAQRTALAQTVGGVRQYTTIMALMDNFDVYQQNLKIAANSEGTVNAQAEIYAKSWEAAQKRVKAASEALYSDLIDDQFFITLNNGFAGFLELLDKIIDGFGGLRTLIPMVGAALTTLFSSQISTGLVNFANSLAMFKPGYAKQQIAAKDSFLANAAQQMIGVKPGTTMTAAQTEQMKYAKADLNIQQRYVQNSAFMSVFDKQLAQMAMDKFSNLRNEYTQTTQQSIMSQNRQREAKGNLMSANSTGLSVYTSQQNADKVAKQQYNSAVQFARLQHTGGQNAPQYFTNTANNVGNWYASNGQFLKSVYDQSFQRSGDLGALSSGISSRQDEIAILQNLKDAGYQGLGAAIKEFKTLSGGQKGTKAILDDLAQRGIINTANKTVNNQALDEQIGIITEEQNQMVTDFAAKWGKSKEAVMQYKDAIVAAKGDTKKLAEIKEKMDQAEKEGLEATKKNQQMQRAQNVVKAAQAMQGAVAAGSSFAAVTQNIVTNIENGESAFANFGQTLSGVTSGFMSAAMVMSAIPGPMGIIIAVASTLIGVLSQIPEVRDFVHNLFTSEDQQQVEEAEATLKQVEAEFEDAKQKAADFLNATDTHNGLLEEINKCIKGTQEFKQAVLDANMHAKQMMKDYSLTLDDFHRTDSGALELNEGVAEKRQKALEAQRDNLEIMEGYSKYEVERSKYQKADNALRASMGSLVTVYGNNTTKSTHKYMDGYEDHTLKTLFDDYLNSGETESFQDYIKSRGGETGWLSAYSNFSKQVSNLGYDSVDQYIQAGKQYGSASSLKFDGIVSELFNNIATSEVFNQDKDVDISSFLSSYLGTAENGETIKNARLMDYYSTLGSEKVNQITSNLAAQNFDITKVAGGFDGLFGHEEFLREFLKVAADFDEAKLADMSLTDLQRNAKSFISAQKGLEIFRDNYDILANNSGVQQLAKVGEKGQNQQRVTAEGARRSIQYWEDQVAAGKELSAEDELLKAYYTNWVKNFEEAKKTMVQNAFDIFADDSLYRILESDNDDVVKEKTEQQETFKKVFKDIIENSALTDEEIAKTFSLGKQIKNVLGEAFEPKQFAELFEESKITQMYRSINWTGPLSALFDVAAMKQRLGNVQTELSEEVNRLYDALLDEDHLNGRAGVLSEIFQEEDFQKQLKEVQKEFKRTGKISTKNIDAISEACEDLDSAFDFNILSAGAVADAIELYSMGAIDSIDSVSEELLIALESANALQDGLRNAFDFIDNWSPDRSVADIGEFFGKSSKDFFSELENGTVGSNRLYQTAQMLWGNGKAGQQYSESMMQFFLGQEGKGYDPQKAQALYTQQFGKFDNVWTQVQKDGHLGAYWNFLLDKSNGSAIEDMLGIEDVSGQLEELGVTKGKNGAIDINTKSGMTTKEFTQQLQDILGLSPEMAETYAQELIGHSAGARFDLESADIMEGWKSITEGPNKGTDLDQALFGEANKSMLDMMQKEFATLSGKDASTLTEAEQKRLDWLTENKGAIDDAVESYKTYDSALKKVNESLEKGSSITEGLTDDERKLIEQKNQIGTEDGKTVYGEGLVEGAMESEEQFQKAKKAAADLGGTFGQVMSDGSVVTAEANESLEDFQERIQKAEETIETNKNKKLGKELFQGILEALDELKDTDQLKNLSEFLKPLEGLSNINAENIQGVADALNSICEKIQNGNCDNIQNLIEALTTLQGFKEINTSIKTEFNPEAESDKGLTHVIEDIRQMQSNGHITVTLEMDDSGDLSKFKEAKGEFNELADTADRLRSPVNITVTGLEELDAETVQQLGAKITELENTPVNLTVALSEGTVATDIQTLLDSLPDTKNIQITYTLPDGTTITSGEQGLFEAIFNPNDQTKIKTLYEDKIQQYKDANAVTDVDSFSGAKTYRALTAEEQFALYNTDYNNTGYSIGSIANGIPSQVITQDMLNAAGYTLSDVYSTNDQGAIVLTEAGAALLEAAAAQKEAATEEAEAAESGNQVDASGEVVTRQGNNKVAINGSVYDLNGTDYSSEQITGIINQIAKESYKLNSSEAEKHNAEQAITELTTQLSTILSEIEKNVKPEEKKGEGKGQEKESGKVKDTVPPGHENDTTAEVGELVANSVTVSDDAEAPTVESVEAESVETGDQTVVKAEVEPEGDLSETLSDVDVSIDTKLNPETNLIEEFTATTADKTVNLKLGENGPGDAIAALPSDIPVSMHVHVQVTAANSFGASVSAGASGAQAAAAAVGGLVSNLAAEEAKSHPAVQNLIAETAKHMKDGGEGCHTINGQGTRGSTKAAGSQTYHSYVNGSANRFSKPGLSLTAEEGPEIIWNKQEGYSYIVGGEGHPEFVELRPGDRIFNANDTRQILNYHRPKSNYNSAVVDPRNMSAGLFSSHAAGSAYGSYGPQSRYNSKGGRGGGGSKGGSSKEFKPERYHLITRQIQDLTFWYEELQKARENAYGTNVLDSIDKEIKGVDELVKANQALLDEVEEYKKTDLAKLSELGIDYVLDEAGNIANFDELQEKYKKKVDEDKDEDAQKAWDAITQYEETLDKWQEVKSELSDQLYDYAELRLERIKVKAEMKIDFDERELKYIDHFLNKINDNLYKTSEVLTMYTSQMGLINNKINATHDAINEVFGQMTDRYGNQISITYDQWLKMSAAEREALDINGNYGKQLEEYADSLLGYIDALEDYRSKGVEELSAAFDELNDKVNSQIDLYNHYSSMLSSLRDLADLQGLKLPASARSTITKLNQTMVQVAKDNIKSYQEGYEGLQKMAEETRQKIANTTNDALRKQYQEDLDKIEADMREKMENVLSLWQEGLSKARDIFDQEMEWAQQDYEASLSDMYNTTDMLQDAFKRKQELNDEYVDDYEKYYQLSKLQRQINKDLDTAAVNGNKQNKNLKALLEEIQQLQKDGSELSAYDLDILAKKYEYEKALADLEDARNAKQTVRLQRDREGNWGYVYTAADGDELAEQEQAVEDKLYEYTKAATEESKDLQEQILSLWAEAGAKVAEMRAAGISDNVIDDYIADTQQKLDFLMAQLEKTGTDVSFALPKWIAITNESFNLTTDTFTETVLSLVTGMETIAQTSDTISAAILKIAETTKTAANAYNSSIDALNQLVSGNDKNFMENAKEWAELIAKSSNENISNVSAAINEMTDMYDKILQKAIEFEKAFMDTYEPIIRRNEEFLAGLINALGQLNGLGNNAGILNYAYNNGVNNVAAYDTGGFTGVWGPDGKLAFLHQKEQVFDEEDTMNILEAANILKTLDFQTNSFERGLGSINSPLVKDFNQTIEQNVHIEAEFPNATNHTEIEEAFNNLANRAIQYANRKVS